MVNFTATRDDLKLISKITERAKAGKGTLTLQMDLDATNSNGCPLDFQKLLDFDNFNFWHDIYGIQSNINRDTGKLENCFVPRSAKHE